MVPRVRGLVGSQDSEDPLAVPAPLLRRARHVLPRVDLQREYGPDGQAVLARDRVLHPLSQAHGVQDGPRRHLLEVVERERRLLRLRLEVALPLHDEGRDDVAAALAAARRVLAPPPLLQR